MKTLHALLTASALALAASSNPVRGAPKDAVEAEDRARRQADIIYVTPDGQRYAIPQNVFGANQGAAFRSLDGEPVDPENEQIANVASLPVQLQPPVALVPPAAVPDQLPLAVPAPVPAPVNSGNTSLRGPKIMRKKASSTVAAAPSVNVPAGIVLNQQGVSVVSTPQAVAPLAPTVVRLRPRPTTPVVQPAPLDGAPPQAQGVVQLAPPPAANLAPAAPAPLPGPVQAPAPVIENVGAPAPQTIMSDGKVVTTDSTTAPPPEEPSQSGPNEVPMDAGTSVFGCWRSRLAEMKASRCKCETACGQQYPSTLPSLCPLARDGDPFRQACVLRTNCTQERNDAFPCKPAADGTYGDVTCELLADVVRSAVRCRMGDGSHWAEGSSRCTPDKPQETKVCSNGEWKVLTYPSPAATCHLINKPIGRGDMGCPYFQATTFTIMDAYKNKYIVIDGRTMSARWDG